MEFIKEEILVAPFIKKEQIEEELLKLFNYDLFRWGNEFYQQKDLRKILTDDSLAFVSMRNNCEKIFAYKLIK